MVLGRTNRTTWGTRLLLTAVLASLVDCISLCHLLKAQHCSLSLNWCYGSSLSELHDSVVVVHWVPYQLSQAQVPAYKDNASS